MTCGCSRQQRRQRLILSTILLAFTLVTSTLGKSGAVGTRATTADSKTAGDGAASSPSPYFSIPNIKLYPKFSAIGLGEREAWANLWSTQAWTMLQALQSTRRDQPLHVLMVGDSTMRKQKAFLCNFLEPGEQHDFHGPDVLESTCFNHKLRLRVTHLWNPCCNTEDLQHFVRRQDEEGGDARRAQTKPDVVYTNCGLHIMHLGAARPFECLPRPFEETVTTFMQTLTAVYPKSLQVMMTTHSICESLFKEEYSEVVKAIALNPDDVIEECSKDLAKRLWRSHEANAEATRADPEGMTKALHALCRDGLMVDATVRRQRKQVMAVVEAERRRSVDARIDVVDGYGITWQQCWASEERDGRHYPYLVPLEAMQLLAVLNRWLLPAET